MMVKKNYDGSAPFYAPLPRYDKPKKLGLDRVYKVPINLSSPQPV